LELKMKMKYKLEDAFQASIGIFSSVLLFLALRSEPLSINPIVGVVITIIWVGLFYNGKVGLPKQNFFMDLAITFILAGALTIVFNLATIEQLLSFDYFGSTAIVAVWLSFPMSILFDKFNITNMLLRHYVRK